MLPGIMIVIYIYFGDWWLNKQPSSRTIASYPHLLLVSILMILMIYMYIPRYSHYAIFGQRHDTTIFGRFTSH